MACNIDSQQPSEWPCQLNKHHGSAVMPHLSKSHASSAVVMVRLWTCSSATTADATAWQPLKQLVCTLLSGTKNVQTDFGSLRYADSPGSLCFTALNDMLMSGSCSAITLGAAPGGAAWLMATNRHPVNQNKTFIWLIRYATTGDVLQDICLSALHLSNQPASKPTPQ